jgi:hypothetical protein
MGKTKKKAMFKNFAVEISLLQDEVDDLLPKAYEQPAIWSSIVLKLLTIRMLLQRQKQYRKLQDN